MHPEPKRLFSLDEALRREADEMLALSGIGAILQHAGYHAVGSYQMRTMTWRDLDFERVQDPPDWRNHWHIGLQLAGTGWPWRQACVNAYRDPRTPGERGLYWGLRVAPPGVGDTWRLHLWTARAEEYQTEPRERWDAAMTEEHRLHILAIKDAVWDRPEYRDTMLSVHIYEAVLEHNVRDLESFLAWWQARVGLPKEEAP
jgi:hypothetical protein